MTWVMLHILAQAVEDALRYELGMPLEAAEAAELEEIYEEALCYIMQYPVVRRRWKENLEKKRLWLEEITDARQAYNLGQTNRTDTSYPLR